MVVGDDMQSIYKFRGADVQNILSFPKKYTDCKVIYLTENYRSSQEILNLANHVMTNATEGYQKNLKAQFLVISFRECIVLTIQKQKRSLY